MYTIFNTSDKGLFILTVFTKLSNLQENYIDALCTGYPHIKFMHVHSTRIIIIYFYTGKYKFK